MMLLRVAVHDGLDKRSTARFEVCGCRRPISVGTTGKRAVWACPCRGSTRTRICCSVSRHPLRRPCLRCHELSLHKPLSAVQMAMGSPRSIKGVPSRCGCTSAQSYNLSECCREARAKSGPCTTEIRSDSRTWSIGSVRTMRHICVKVVLLLQDCGSRERPGGLSSVFVHLSFITMPHHHVIRRRSSASSIKKGPVSHPCRSDNHLSRSRSMDSIDTEVLLPIPPNVNAKRIPRDLPLPRCDAH